jgi:hypothetical protein
MAFLTCLIICKRKLAFVLILHFRMRIFRNIVMAGFTLDPNGAMCGMIKVILRHIQREDLATGKGHAQIFIPMTGQTVLLGFLRRRLCGNS